MKITAIDTAIIEIPLPKTLKTAIHVIRSICGILVTVETDEGIRGESYQFTLGPEKTRVIQEMISSLATLLIGADPRNTEKNWAGLWGNINFFGHKGITVFAISALDTACWDIKGKAVEQPLYRFLGGYCDMVPVYASGGLWLSQSKEELVEEAGSFVQQGFQAMKMRIGSPNPKQDLERVRAVREAIGPDVELMVDANQGLSVQHAIRLGRKLEPYDICWFEEPVPAYDIQANAEVRAALPGLPIALGETEYTLYGFRDVVGSKTADILMPDLGRVGGISEFLKVSHLAQAHSITISPHIFSEQSIQVLGALSNGGYLEYVPWFSELYNERLEIVDGKARVPERPGIGFTFDRKFIERHRIDQ